MLKRDVREPFASIVGKSGMKSEVTSPRHIQTQKSANMWRQITLDVESDADRLSCEYSFRWFERSLGSREAERTKIEGTWKSTCYSALS